MAGKISYDTWFSYLWNLKNSKPKIRNFSKKILFQISFKRILINILLQGLENIENNDKLVKSESYIFFRLAKKI